MFEYFPDNYAWSLTTATLFDEVGTVSEPEEALRAVKHLAGGDKDSQGRDIRRALELANDLQEDTL